MADMEIIELPNFKDVWECSECGKQFKDTKKFRMSNYCPNCDAFIDNWFDFEEE